MKLVVCSLICYHCFAPWLLAEEGAKAGINGTWVMKGLSHAGRYSDYTLLNIVSSNEGVTITCGEVNPRDRTTATFHVEGPYKLSTDNNILAWSDATGALRQSYRLWNGFLITPVVIQRDSTNWEYVHTLSMSDGNHLETFLWRFEHDPIQKRSGTVEVRSYDNEWESLEYELIEAKYYTSDRFILRIRRDSRVVQELVWEGYSTPVYFDPLHARVGEWNVYRRLTDTDIILLKALAPRADFLQAIGLESSGSDN